MSGRAARRARLAKVERAGSRYAALMAMSAPIWAASVDARRAWLAEKIDAEILARLAAVHGL